MKERLNSLLSEVGESFDYLKSDVRNLGRYLAELEELIESYRAFTATAILSTPGDQKARGKLLKKTYKVLGPPPDRRPTLPGTNDEEVEKAVPGTDTQIGTLIER